MRSVFIQLQSWSPLCDFKAHTEPTEMGGESGVEHNIVSFLRDQDLPNLPCYKGTNSFELFLFSPSVYSPMKSGLNLTVIRGMKSWMWFKSHYDLCAYKKHFKITQPLEFLWPKTLIHLCSLIMLPNYMHSLTGKIRRFQGKKKTLTYLCLYLCESGSS